jgi:putative transposase
MCVRWYVAYPLSLRHQEEMMAERGIAVDHSTVHRWALKLLPVQGKVFSRHKRSVGKSWRMDETYRIRQSKYLNNLVEQDHRAIKRRRRPMLGFKNFRCARILLGGIECMHMIAKGQMKCAPGTHQSLAD